MIKLAVLEKNKHTMCQALFKDFVYIKHGPYISINSSQQAYK